MLGNQRIIALCTAKVHDKSIHKFVTELNKKIVEDNGSLFIYNMQVELYWDDSKICAETAVYDLINYDITDLVIIMDEKIKHKSITKKIVEKAHNAKVPVIIVDGNEEGCSSVRFDFEKGFEKVVRHVVEDHKLKKVHYMGGLRNDFFSDERLRVFKKVIEENGIPFDDSMVSYGDYWAGPTRQATEELIKRENLPEAIICANDLMAFNVCNVLQNHGISVPEQVAVTGFDGVEETFFFVPRLTSCRCGDDIIANATYQAVKECFENPGTVKEYFVEPEFIKLESCGCVSDYKAEVTDYLSLINNRFVRYQDENAVLSDIAERIQSCDSLKKASQQMKSYVLYNMCCLVNKRYIDSGANPIHYTSETPFEETMCVFFDTEEEDFTPYEMSQEKLIPYLSEIAERNYPLIFNALDFMGVPVGYVCFHYDSTDILHYCKIPQTITALNNAIGGYANMQYQRYLAYKIEEMYKLDSLTGIYNRQGFVIEYEKLQKKLKKKAGNITVVMADLDGLKKINDVHGHAAGDFAIHSMAKALVYACPDNALCVRFGGDEMVAVIEGSYDEGKVRSKFKEYIDELNEKSKLPYVVSASLGIYVVSSTEDIDFESLIKNADKLMYAEKNRKKSHAE